DGVAGGFGGVGPAGRSRPPEGPVGKLIHFPPGVLLEPVVVTALRAGVAETGAAAGLIRGVVLKVAPGGGPTADRAGAGSVPDPGKVPELDRDRAPWPGIGGRRGRWLGGPASRSGRVRVRECAAARCLARSAVRPGWPG